MILRARGPWFATLAALAAGCAASRFVKPSTPVYPYTPTTNVTDVYFGVPAPDPYRWLEDDHSPATQAWVEAQNRVTFGYLAALPQREAIKTRIAQLWRYERFSPPFRRGGHYFFTHNDGLQNQNVLFVASNLDSEPTVLLDPNTLSADGTVALKGYVLSDDGSKIAYGLSAAGSDWEEWRVREVATATDTPDRLDWVKFSGASWKKDGSGFYYSRYDAPPDGGRLTQVNENQKLFFHALGRPQSADTLIYARPDHPKWGFGGEVTEDGGYLVISASEGTDTRNRVFYQILSANGPVIELLDEFDAKYHFIGNEGALFYFYTDLKAPRGRVIAIDLARPDRSQWKEIVPEADATLTGASLVADRLILDYLRDARSEVKTAALDGRPMGAIDLPGVGTAGGFGGRRDDQETFYSFTSVATPGRVYRHDFKTGRSTLWKQPKTAFNPEDYTVDQVFYRSRDGTRAPMFLAYKKGLKPTGKTPTLMYAYGGFNISLTPTFNVANLAWMEMGGLYAQPTLRGGGEYGDAWHKAGTKLQKQNVFDDFISAGEWLIGNGWTKPSRLAISGGSNGGLLVGACMTQRPDLFGACLPAVGVMDMLRFQKFTIGWAWTSDYGSSDNPDEFKALFAYSPYHNLKSGVAYPPTLVTTGDHDDRVVPAHSFKFAARLQACQRGENPVLIRIETKGGHGAGKPTAKIIEESADRLAFVAAQFDLPGAPQAAP